MVFRAAKVSAPQKTEKKGGRTERGECLAADGVEVRVRRCTTETSKAVSHSAFM